MIGESEKKNSSKREKIEKVLGKECRSRTFQEVIPSQGSGESPKNDPDGTSESPQATGRS